MIDTGEAHATIEAHKAEADNARKRADSLELRMEEMAALFQGIVDDLQGKLFSCRAELELTTREAELSRRWLVHLSTEIMDRLGDAPTKLEELALEMLPKLATLPASDTSVDAVIPQVCDLD